MKKRLSCRRGAAVNRTAVSLRWPFDHAPTVAQARADAPEPFSHRPGPGVASPALMRTVSLVVRR